MGADLLSRGKLDKFWECYPREVIDQKMTEVPDKLWPLQKFWRRD